MLLTRRGFTLVELIMALMLMGIVSTGIYTLLINNQRLYRQQTQKIEVNDNLRSTVAILTSELRELDTQDPLGSDIIEMTDSYITYRAMRGVRWVCFPVGGLPVVGNLLAVDTSRFGYPALDNNYDSLLIFADSNIMQVRDDRWFHASITSTPQAAVDCGGSSRRINFQLNVSGRTNGLVAGDDVVVGAVVRPFQIVKMTRYTDVTGATWLGMQRIATNGNPDQIQPVAGPLQAGGLTFVYYDANGNVTANRTQVARIQITVIARTSDPVVQTATGVDYLVDTLVTQVALRNNR